jgi:outer membrane protein insertion porin family
VPIYEKFFVGGIQTLRGFEYGKAGPLDAQGEPLGATKMITLQNELIFPLARQIGLRGAVFFDIGKGFELWKNFFPLKMGVGVGVRWFSPFGPIHIDFGINPNPQKGEKPTVFDFTMGTVF